MQNVIKLTWVVIGLGLLSCSPKYYSPNTHNVPLISEKGEKNLTLAGNGNQVEVQTAYGVTNGLAVKANGGLFTPTDLSNGNGGSGKFLELGAGYFTPVSGKWVFETYGIMGFGSFENHLPSTQNSYPQTKGDISANVLRIGIQPNFGYKSTYFSAAISSRFVNLSYDNIKGDLIFRDVDQLDYLKQNSSNFLIEPALTIKAGLEKVKFQIQYGQSLNLSNSDFRQKNSFMTIGLNLNFN